MSKQKLQKGSTTSWASTRQAAQYFGIHPKTLGQLIKRGELPKGTAILVGNAWRFDIAKLEGHFEKVAGVKHGNL